MSGAWRWWRFGGAAVLLLALACTRPNPHFHGGADEDLGPAATTDLGPGESDLEVEEPDQGGLSQRPAAAFFVEVLGQPPFLEDQAVEVVVSPVDAAGHVTAAYAGQPHLRATRGEVVLLPGEELHARPDGRWSARVRFNREGELAVKAVDGPLLGETRLLTVRHGRWLPSDGPVFSWGPAGAWDDRDANMPAVIEVEGLRSLYYRGRNLDREAPRGGIGRATLQEDGAWLRSGAEALLADQDAGPLGPATYSAPTVLRGPEGWLLWATVTRPDGAAIQLARSVDGLTWEGLDDEPVLSPHAGRGERDLYDPCVLAVPGAGYQMWYSIASHDGSSAIGFAQSEDGVVWETSADNPVLEPGAGSWDGALVRSPTVLRDGDVLRMWYAGSAAVDDAPVSIGYATSSNGVRWQKSSDNPVLAPGGSSFDELRVDHPAALLGPQGPELFYAGFSGERWRIGQAAGREL